MVCTSGRNSCRPSCSSAGTSMASLPAQARVSRLAFVSDLTQANTPQIPLGYMLEAVWPDQARWLGLIGRTELVPHELKLVNLATWPEMSKPFGLLDRTFDASWENEWGQAGETLRRLWFRSPLLVETAARNEMLVDMDIDSDAAWAITVNLLAECLSALGQHIRPLEPA